MFRSDVQRILEEVHTELQRARQGFAPFNSPHEGYAVLLEEVEELKREVFWGTPAKARAEAVQVAAMALRMLHDCYPQEPR